MWKIMVPNMCKFVKGGCTFDNEDSSFVPSILRLIVILKGLFI